MFLLAVGEDDVAVPDLFPGGDGDLLGGEHHVLVDEGLDRLEQDLLGLGVAQTGLEAVDAGLEEADGVAHGDGERAALSQEGDVGLQLGVEVPAELLLRRSHVIANNLEEIESSSNSDAMSKVS